MRMDADVPAALAAIAAAAISHERFHAARAAAAGGEVRRCGGGVLTYGPDPGQGGWMTVFFVERPSQRPRAVADEVLDWIADLPPLRSVGWWTTGTEEHAPLAAALLARGFQWGWRPHWMWLDLTKPRPRFVLPSGIGTVRFPDGPGAPAAGLPEAVRRFGVGHEALLRLDPPSTTVFAAFDAAEVVGAVTLHVARSGAGDAPEPVGGIYDCWVVERARRRGIGAALTAAAADRAQALGRPHRHGHGPAHVPPGGLPLGRLGPHLVAGGPPAARTPAGRGDGALRRGDR
jgi:ribosomal protein S18 acetylase RimI-like enzyme